ncbi:MAG: hypothetical protein KJZ91_00160 [Myxococcales bacterium]|nr:hypothetical protein [Myxococcales bacterium]
MALTLDGVRVVPWRRAVAARDARRAWRERGGWLIVIEAAGRRGIGEASPLPGFAPAAVVAAPRDAVADPGLTGPALADAELCAAVMRAAAAAAPVLGAPAARAALRFAAETAVLDLQARARGVRVADLLAAAPAARVPLNAVVADVAGAGAALARGVTTLKVKVDADRAATAARLGALAAALPPGATLRLDANQSWPRAEVPARLAELAAGACAGVVAYVEEPAAALAPSLRAPLPLPVALDESLAGADREAWLDRALASGAVTALVLKPTVLGGLAACLALAARARAHGVDAVVTHALEGPVATAAAAELARALAPAGAVGLDRHPTLASWSVAVPQLAAAAVIAAPGAGLGLDIDAVLAAAAEAPPVVGAPAAPGGGP